MLVDILTNVAFLLGCMLIAGLVAVAVILNITAFESMIDEYRRRRLRKVSKR